MNLEKARTLRRAILLELVKQIEGGEFLNDDEMIDLHRLYMLHSPVRKEYQRPLDIDWGAGMRASEIDATYEKG
ncbi:MAG: hypothetical protein CMB80_25580 [Flammeovirgaceae bacterium]|nr:hypothetical protein [Flammeovirgaceae bacterium]